MRAIIIQQYGGPEQLVIQDIPEPQPAPGQEAHRLMESNQANGKIVVTV